MVFTLIQKFQYDKTKKYPLLSERNDIFVLVDEAHRTQYKQLAENMHTGLPNANYTPLQELPCWVQSDWPTNGLALCVRI